MNLEKINEDLKKQNSELTSKLLLTESNLKNAMRENSELERNYNDTRSELELLRSNYDEVVHQNKIMNDEIYGKNAKIESTSLELQNLRNLLTKLSDVKNILNKHLTANNNNFR
jgi:chromosome segregation ATPase